MPSTTTEARERYLDLIEATLRHALAERLNSPPSDGLTTELALPAIACRLKLICKRDPLVVAATTRLNESAGDASVFDGAGQTRSIYRPLVIRTLDPLVRDLPWSGFADNAKASHARVLRFSADDAPLLAVDGAEIVARLFEALANLTSGYLPSLHAEGAAVDAFARLVRSQDDDGLLLARSSADQLEPAWYHELAALHALSLFADYAESAAPRAKAAVSARAAVKRSARYHAEQVQPDHASSHPFGLAALLDDAEGIHLADMMLHAAGVQQPATMDAVSLVLLFDALDCGRRPRPA